MESTLTNVKFDSAFLGNTDFRGAELYGASFLGANMKNCIIFEISEILFDEFIYNPRTKRRNNLGRRKIETLYDQLSKI